MKRITVLRVEADSGPLARLLATLPGVEAVETLPEPTEDASAAETPTTGDTTPTETAADSGTVSTGTSAAPGPTETTRTGEAGGHQATDDSSGPVNRVTPDSGLTGTVTPETDVPDEGKASLLREYGLLGAGVSFVVLGIATVGIWVSRRRSGDGESETPPTAFEPETTASGTPAPSGETDPMSPATESESDTTTGGTAEPAGRTEDNRDEVEWTTRDTGPARETRDSFDPDTETTAEPAGDDETGPRPGESLDPAPLLGVAFVLLSGALVRWLQSGEDQE